MLFLQNQNTEIFQQEEYLAHISKVEVTFQTKNDDDLYFSC